MYNPPEGDQTAGTKLPLGRAAEFVLRTTIHFVFGNTGMLDRGEQKDSPGLRILRNIIGYGLYAAIDLKAGMNIPCTLVFLAGRAASHYMLNHPEKIKTTPVAQFFQDTGMQFFFGHTKESEVAAKARPSARVGKALGYSLYVVSFVASGTTLPWALTMTVGWYGLERGMAYMRRRHESKNPPPPKIPPFTGISW